MEPFIKINGRPYPYPKVGLGLIDVTFVSSARNANAQQNQILAAAVNLLQIIADKDMSVNISDKTIAVSAQRGGRQQGFPIYPAGDLLGLNGA